MSAYIVDRNEIDYLVFVAHAWRGGRLSIYTKGEGWRDVTKRELGQLLWDENIKSVEHRYPSDAIDQLPGTIGDAPYIYDASPSVWLTIDPLQVIKAAKCYQYQACEHDGWHDSTAKHFIDGLIDEAITKITGYSKLAWGAPTPSNARPLTVEA